MKYRPLTLWSRFRVSFWFVPTFFVLVAAVCGALLPMVESKMLTQLDNLPWLATTPDGARTVLSAIAGAMITVTGVIFSVTMATLSIASSQFGSRVLRQNLRNQATQYALASFLATSVYCFLVLRSVNGAEDSVFVPQIAVGVGIAAAVVSVFVLIYFIQDVSETVQAPYVAARLAGDLNDSINRLFPEMVGEDVADASSEGDPANRQIESTEDQARRTDDPREREADCLIRSNQEGYLQAVDAERLLQLTVGRNAVLELLVRPGQFLTHDDLIGRLWGDELPEDAVAEEVQGSLLVGESRTPEQDVNCAILEIAQLTVRALSPGINDPFTAMNGIDRLSAALARLAQRRIPTSLRMDDEDHLRVISEPVTFREALAAAFNQIRQHCKNSPPVGVRMFEGLRRITEKALRQEDLKAIQKHGRMLLDTYLSGDLLPSDLKTLERQFDLLEERIDERSKSSDTESTQEEPADGEASSKEREENNSNRSEQDQRSPSGSSQPEPKQASATKVDDDAEAPPAEGDING